MSAPVCTVEVGALCGQPAIAIIHVRATPQDSWEEYARCGDHPAEHYVPLIRRVSPMAEIRVERLTAIPANGGFDCSCGHTIVEDGTCCCPAYCPTCASEDCCAEAWARFEAGLPAADPWAEQDLTVSPFL